MMDLTRPAERTTGPLPQAAPPHPHRRPRTPVTVALVGAGTFVAATLVAGALDPGYSHRLDAISSLAARDAETPAVMFVGFLGLAAALLGAGVALSSLRGARAVVGSALVVLAGVAAVVVGCARLDCSALASTSCAAREHAGTVSTSHVVHNLVSLLLFTAVVVGLFLLSSALRRRDDELRPSARPTLAAAIAALALMVWFGSGSYDDDGGLVQRAFLLVAVGWPVYLAHRVTRSGPPADRAIAAAAEPTAAVRTTTTE